MFVLVINNLNLQILLRISERYRVGKVDDVSLLAVLKHTQHILFGLVVSGAMGTPTTDQKERLI